MPITVVVAAFPYSHPRAHFENVHEITESFFFFSPLLMSEFVPFFVLFFIRTARPEVPFRAHSAQPLTYTQTPYSEILSASMIFLFLYKLYNFSLSHSPQWNRCGCKETKAKEKRKNRIETKDSELDIEINSIATNSILRVCECVSNSAAVSHFLMQGERNACVCHLCAICVSERVPKRMKCAHPSHANGT